MRPRAAATQKATPGATQSIDGGGDDVGLAPGPDGEADSLPETSGPPTPTRLRVAHLSPDLPPIDVCLAPHGTSHWSGPLTGQLVGGDAGAPGLTYAQVSAYLPVGPGPFDVLLVPAGSASCPPLPLDLSGDAGAEAAAPADAEPDATPDASITDANESIDGSDANANDATPFDAGSASDAGPFPRLPVITSLPALPAAGYATLVIAGEVSPTGSDMGLTFTLVVDDGELAGGAASLRAINALPRVASMDLDLGAFGMKWTTLLADVPFGAASAQSTPNNGVVDANGYLPIAPFSGATLSARAAIATVDTAIASSVTIPLGSVATIIAVSGPAGDAAHPAALLLCVDNQPSGGLLSDCSIAQ